MGPREQLRTRYAARTNGAGSRYEKRVPAQPKPQCSYEDGLPLSPPPSSSKYPMNRKCGRMQQASPDTKARPTRHVPDTKNAPQLNQSPNAATRRASSQPTAILFGVSDEPRMRPNAASWPRYNSAANAACFRYEKRVPAQPKPQCSYEDGLPLSPPPSSSEYPMNRECVQMRQAGADTTARPTRHVSDTKKISFSYACGRIPATSSKHMPRAPATRQLSPACGLSPPQRSPTSHPGSAAASFAPVPSQHQRENHPARHPQYPAPPSPAGCAEASPSRA